MALSSDSLDCHTGYVIVADIKKQKTGIQNKNQYDEDKHRLVHLCV